MVGCMTVEKNWLRPPCSWSPKSDDLEVKMSFLFLIQIVWFLFQFVFRVNCRTQTLAFQASLFLSSKEDIEALEAFVIKLEEGMRSWELYSFPLASLRLRESHSERCEKMVCGCWTVTYKHTHTYAHMHAHTHAHTHTLVCTHVCACAHAHTHTHKHAHINTFFFQNHHYHHIIFSITISYHLCYHNHSICLCSSLKNSASYGHLGIIIVIVIVACSRCISFYLSLFLRWHCQFWWRASSSSSLSL